MSHFKHPEINLSFMQTLAKLSIEADGPVVARDFLRDHGIALVVEPHFPQTYLDGATIMRDKSHPVIGLTIRHDRLDNFWYTLMHELAHIALHFDQQVSLFYDDLDNPDVGNTQEQEADAMAGEALVPEDKWKDSPARLIPSLIAAESLAQEIGVHTAIVAGRMRHVNRQYVYLNAIINRAKVRQYFPSERWSK
jgi:HTH-type transcriptional regulator/antitoxin HigA